MTLDLEALKELAGRATRWVCVPGPGQFRGAGDWQVFRGTEDEWRYLVETGFLPTFEGEDSPTPPADKEG